MERIANRLSDLWTTITTDPVFLKGRAEAVLILAISAGAWLILRQVLKSVEKRVQSVPYRFRS